MTFADSSQIIVFAFCSSACVLKSVLPDIYVCCILIHHTPGIDTAGSVHACRVASRPRSLPLNTTLTLPREEAHLKMPATFLVCGGLRSDRACILCSPFMALSVRACWSLVCAQWKPFAWQVRGSQGVAFGALPPPPARVMGPLFSIYSTNSVYSLYIA